MIFSQSELICLNSVLDSSSIFGTHFKAPASISDEYIAETVDSLFKKGSWMKPKNPTSCFMLPQKSWKTIRNLVIIFF